MAWGRAGPQRIARIHWESRGPFGRRAASGPRGFFLEAASVDAAGGGEGAVDEEDGGGVRGGCRGWGGGGFLGLCAGMEERSEVEFASGCAVLGGLAEEWCWDIKNKSGGAGRDSPIEFHWGGVKGHGLGLGLRDGEAGEGGLAEVKVKVDEGGVRRRDGVMEGEGAEGRAKVVGGGSEETAEVRRAANYGSRGVR